MKKIKWCGIYVIHFSSGVIAQNKIATVLCITTIAFLVSTIVLAVELSDERENNSETTTVAPAATTLGPATEPSETTITTEITTVTTPTTPTTQTTQTPPITTEEPVTEEPVEVSAILFII